MKHVSSGKGSNGAKTKDMNDAHSETFVRSDVVSISVKTEKAFVQAFDEFAPKLYRFCLVRVGSRELAEDLVSQTFLQVWQYLQGGGVVKSYPAFLYRTLRNLTADFWRSKRAKEISLDEVSGELVDQEHLPEVLGEALSKDMELQKALKTLNRLSKDQRDILYWRFVDDLSIKDIAELSGKKPNAIYVSIYRGVRRLGKYLNNK